MSNLYKSAFLFFPIFILLIILSYYNNWHYDEAWTYIASERNTIKDLFLYTNYKYANNQILNSLYFKLIQFFKISNVLFYRLTSLLGFVVFFYANTNILKYFSLNRNLILILISAPYFLYFTLGRGYGLSLGFFSLSLMFLLDYVSNKKIITSYFFILTGALSMLSIYSFLYCYSALILVYLFYNRRKLLSIHIIVQMSFVLFTLIYVYYAGSIINEFDKYIIGSEYLFLNGTISSLINDFCNFYNFYDISYFFLLKIINIIIFGVSFFFGLIKKELRIYFIKSLLLFVIIIGLIFFLMTMANTLFHAKFPLGRAVMYLHYLLLLMIILSTQYYVKKIYYLPIILLFAFSIVNNALLYTNLLKPSIRSVLEQTKSYPLFVSGHNPNIIHTNNLYKLKKESEINLSSKAIEINDFIKDGKSKGYILTKKNVIDSLNLQNETFTICQDGLYFIEIEVK